MMGSEEQFLQSLGMGQGEGKGKDWLQWLRAIPKPSRTFAPRVLILGDVGTGKSGLAYWLLESLSKEYNMLPLVVDFPRDKRNLLAENFAIIDKSEVKDKRDAIILIDEADLQLPFNDAKMVKPIINFLNLPRQRHQILLLAFHYPRLVRGTYLPSFSTFLLKRPPYLLEFAGKADSKELVNMMKRAEERFAELPDPSDAVKWTYVIAPGIRWQGFLHNELPTFWTEELSESWSGIDVDSAPLTLDSLIGKPVPKTASIERIGYIPLADGQYQKDKDGQYFLVTAEMKSRKVKVKSKEFQNSSYAVYKDPTTGIHWAEGVCSNCQQEVTSLKVQGNKQLCPSCFQQSRGQLGHSTG